MNISTEKLGQNIWKMYVIKFFSASVFLVPVMVLFWQENGLSLTEIMMLQSFYAITIVILEVPSGYLADRVGRKKVLVIATIMYFLGQFILALGTGFWWFFFSEILFAFSASFVSGADSAFLYDSLYDLGRKDEYKKIWGSIGFTFLSIMALSAILGGYFAKYGVWSGENVLRQVAFLGSIFVFFAIPVSFTLYEPRRHKHILKKGYIQDLKETLAKELRSKKSLWGVMLLFVFLGASLQFALRFYQPYFVHIGVDVLYFGLIFGGFQLFTGLISKYAEKIENILGMTYLLILSAILLVVSYLGMARVGVMRGLVFCFFQQFVRGIYGVVISDYIHQRVSSKYRATIQSIQNLGKSLVYALFLPFFGRVADVYSLVDALLVIGTIIGIILLFLFLFLFGKQILNFRF